MSDAKANKKIVRDFYEGGAYDRNAWREMDKGLFSAFADFSLQVLDQVAEGDLVATRYTLGGTHTGEFAGIPPSGAVARLGATAMDRVADGKLVEHWVDLDLTAFLQALTPPAKSFPTKS